MRVAVLHGRITLVVDDRAVDAHRWSGGAIPSNPQQMFAKWTELPDLAERLEHDGYAADTPVLDRAALDAPDPCRSSIVGPNEPVATRTESLDWEAELVVVIGKECDEVTADDTSRIDTIVESIGTLTTRVSAR